MVTGGRERREQHLKTHQPSHETCTGQPTVVLMGFTCPATTVVTVALRALDRVRERALGLLCRSITQIPARQALRGVPDLPRVCP